MMRCSLRWNLCWGDCPLTTDSRLTLFLSTLPSEGERVGGGREGLRGKGWEEESMEWGGEREEGGREVGGR